MMRLFAFILLSIGVEGNETTHDGMYKNVKEADARELLEKVHRLPLGLVESDQQQPRLGITSISELASLLPEAVVHTKEENARVDENILFNFGLGALQAMFREQIALRSDLLVLSEHDKKTTDLFQVLSAKLDGNVSEEVMNRLQDAEDRKKRLLEEEVKFDQVLQRKLDEAKRRDMNERETILKNKDQVHRLRLEDSEVKARARARDRFALKKEGFIRSEEERREQEREAAIEKVLHENELEDERRLAELKRVNAEAKAKAAAQRENEDVHLRAMKAKAAEDRKRLLEALALASSYISRGTAALLDDPRLLAALVFTMIALLAGFFFARETAKLARSLAAAYFGRPRLVRETSRKRFYHLQRFVSATYSISTSILKWILHNFIYITLLQPLCWHFAGLVERIFCIVATIEGGGLEFYRRAWPAITLRRRNIALARATVLAARLADENKALHKKAIDQRYNFLQGVVLPESLKERVARLAVATSNSKRNNAPFRHVLLHGPPGTGKTLVAKRMAKASGLEYALMTGGDVGPLGSHGVTALHSLFRWARTSPTGVLVFIDEAEAFLASRSRAKLTEDMRNALNAFLYQTGSPTRSFVLVLATNRADDLDDAVLDRVDETLFFDVPTLKARIHLVHIYYQAYILNLALTAQNSGYLQRLLGRPTPLVIHNDITHTLLDSIASETHGFSGREIEKLFVAVQSAAYAHSAELNAKILMDVVHLKAEEHKKRGIILSHEDSLQQHQQKEQDKDQREIDDIVQRMNSADGFLSEFYAGKLQHHNSSTENNLKANRKSPVPKNKSDESTPTPRISSTSFSHSTQQQQQQEML